MITVSNVADDVKAITASSQNVLNALPHCLPPD